MYQLLKERLQTVFAVGMKVSKWPYHDTALPQNGCQTPSEIRSLILSMYRPLHQINVMKNKAHMDSLCSHSVPGED